MNDNSRNVSYDEFFNSELLITTKTSKFFIKIVIFIKKIF